MKKNFYPISLNPCAIAMGIAARYAQNQISADYSFDYCFGLHGAARSSYVKSRKSVGEVSVFIYDSEGKLIELVLSTVDIWLNIARYLRRFVIY